MKRAAYRRAFRDGVRAARLLSCRSCARFHGSLLAKKRKPRK